MHAQVHTSASGRARLKGNCLYTPTYSASDREEEEVESSDPDLSDYYSDSGYPTRPRPRLVVWSSRRNKPPLLVQVPRQQTTPTKLQRRTGTPPHKRADSSHARNRKLPVVSTTVPRESYSAKAFNKLRSLRNNRVIPVSSPEYELPPSSLVTTSITANGTRGTSGSPKFADSDRHVGQSMNPESRQLRSFSLPSGDGKMAQAKLKKTKKVSRALSFSFGSGDKKKRTRNFLGSPRSGGEALVDDPQVPHSPVLLGGRRGGRTGTIYEEETNSLSSAEEDEQRLNSMNYLHGNRFGSCRELSSAGLAVGGGSANPPLQSLSKGKHKRPSLPSFTKFLHVPQPRQVSGSHHQEGNKTNKSGSHTTHTSSSGPPHTSEKSPACESSPGSATSSPLPREKFRRRKLSDPGSAPSTPEAGNSPPAERRLSREEGGIARSGRPLRKGFTFCVGGGNLSPDWVSVTGVCVYVWAEVVAEIVYLTPG